MGKVKEKYFNNISADMSLDIATSEIDSIQAYNIYVEAKKKSDEYFKRLCEVEYQYKKADNDYHLALGYLGLIESQLDAAKEEVEKKEAICDKMFSEKFELEDRIDELNDLLTTYEKYLEK